MGQRRDYLCPACGLEGCVSGGEDVGMTCATTTIYCPACDRLRDVVVKDWFGRKGATPDNPVVLEPRCTRRKAHAVKVWNVDLPCPRCGQTVLQPLEGGQQIDWD